MVESTQPKPTYLIWNNRISHLQILIVKLLAMGSFLASSTLILIISLHSFHQSIHADVLKVGVPWKTGFTEFVSVNATNITGFCVEVFEAAIKNLTYSVKNLSYSVHYIPFGDGNTEPDYNDLVGNITSGEFDAVVGDITITAARAQNVSFTQAVLDAGLVAVVRLRNKDISILSGFSFLKPFSAGVWVLILGFFFTGGLVIYLLERRKNSGSKKFGNIVWFSFSTFFTNQNDMKTVMGRIVVIAWLFLTGTLYSCYTANLSAILTAPRLEPTLNDIHSVVASGVNIGFQEGSFAKTQLTEYFKIDGRRLKALNKEEEYYNALSNGTVGAIIDERPYMESLVAKHCNIFTFAGKSFTTQNWGFAFNQKNATLAENISIIILELADNGTLEEFQKKWLPYYHEDCSGYTPPESGQIQVDSVWGLFVVSGLVTVIVLLIYLVRWKCNASKLAPQTVLPDSSGHVEGSEL